MASPTSFIPYLCVAVAAFITTFLAVPLVKRLAIKLDAVDYPSKRRINTKPIPRMGGTAVFLGLVVACIVQILGTWYLGWPPALVPHPRLHISYPILALSFTVIFATGAIDDVFQLKPKQKLAGQVLAALIACVGGLRIGVIVNPFAPGEIMLGWLAYPITVVYLVAFTNIINLIDGLDGLATGICGIASFTMFSVAVLSGRIDAAALSIALFGSCLAFLRYNFNPASIFLGDSGSLLLGFALGSISLLNVSRTAALTSLIIPLIVAGVPIIDTFSAIVRRKRAHISIGQADKGHIHHRLIQEGYNQKQAVLLIYAWCIMLSAGAAAINQVEVPMRVLIFTVLAIGSAAFAKHLHLFEPVLRHHYNKRTHEDELVTPDDPAFKQEEQAAEERKEERHHKLYDKLPRRRPGAAGQAQPRRAHRTSRPSPAPRLLTTRPSNKRVIILTHEYTLGAIMPNENSYEVALQKSNAIREGLAKTPEKFTMLTGDRPTGRLHLGHYFGTLKGRVELQNMGAKTNVLIADYQVITDRDTTEHIQDNVYNMVMDYLACGIDPDKTMIYAHSAVPAANQLMLPFLSLVSEAELARNPTVKAEMEASGHELTGLLLTYPVHQACDILFCKGNVVPVCRDQLPHIELTRTIARRFNNRYGKVFPEVDALLSETPLLPGLDGRKMSKSYGNAINISMTAEETAKRIKKSQTDSERMITFDPENRPGVSGLLSTAAICTGRSEVEIAEEIGMGGSGQLKKYVTEAVNEYFAPIRERRQRYENDLDYVKDVLHEGNRRANEIAEQTLAEVRDAMGMVY